MGYNVKLQVKLANGGDLSADFYSDKLKPLGGLKSGKPVRLTQSEPGGYQGIVIKPYYRKFKNGDLHIFAVEVPSAQISTQ